MMLVDVELCVAVVFVQGQLRVGADGGERPRSGMGSWEQCGVVD